MIKNRVEGFAKLRRLAVVTAVVSIVGCGEGDSVEVPHDSKGQDVNEASAALVNAHPDFPRLRDEASLNLVTQLDLPGRTLKFFEPKAGNILIFEAGRPELAAVQSDENQLDPVQLYERLSSKKAPPGLLASNARVKAKQQSAGANVPATQNVEPTTFKQGEYSGPVEKSNPGAFVPETWFLLNYCQPTDRFWDAVNASGDSWLHGTGYKYMNAGAFCRIGTIHYHGYYSLSGGQGDDIADYDLSAGWYGNIRDTSLFGQDTASEVTLADQAVYDHCVNWHY